MHGVERAVWRRWRWAGWWRAADPPVDQVLGCAAKEPLKVPTDPRVDQVLPCSLLFVVRGGFHALCDHNGIKRVHCFVPFSVSRSSSIRSMTRAMIWTISRSFRPSAR